MIASPERSETRAQAIDTTSVGFVRGRLRHHPRRIARHRGARPGSAPFRHQCSRELARLAGLREEARGSALLHRHRPTPELDPWLAARPDAGSDGGWRIPRPYAASPQEPYAATGHRRDCSGGGAPVRRVHLRRGPSPRLHRWPPARPRASRHPAPRCSMLARRFLDRRRQNPRSPTRATAIDSAPPRSSRRPWENRCHRPAFGAVSVQIAPEASDSHQPRVRRLSVVRHDAVPTPSELERFFDRPRPPSSRDVPSRLCRRKLHIWIRSWNGAVRN